MKKKCDTDPRTKQRRCRWARRSVTLPPIFQQGIRWQRRSEPATLRALIREKSRSERGQPIRLRGKAHRRPCATPTLPTCAHRAFALSSLSCNLRSLAPGCAAPCARSPPPHELPHPALPRPLAIGTSIFLPVNTFMRLTCSSKRAMHSSSLHLSYAFT